MKTKNHILTGSFPQTITPPGSTQARLIYHDPRQPLIRLFVTLVLLLSVGLFARAAQIGPDGFGYIATDGVPYSFQDISGTGIQILAGQDDGTIQIPIGFTFNFYGVGYNNVGVSVNGLLTFAGLNGQFGNVDLTTTAPSANIPSVAVLWDDWFASPGAIYYQTVGPVGTRRLIVQWNNIMHFGGTAAETVTFQAILNERNGSLKLQYQDVDVAGYTGGSSATVAIRDANGEVNGRVLQWEYNGSAVIADGQAIEFRPTRKIGPDQYGYTATDNWPYNFEDISTTGTAVLAGADDTAISIPIGFSFNFYGANYANVGISPNGLMTFGGLNGQFGNVDLQNVAPSGDLPSIAVLWDDWIFSATGSSAYYQTLGVAPDRRLVVQWNHNTSFNAGTTDTATFEVVLYEASQCIKVQVSDGNVGNDDYSYGHSATVGVRDHLGQTNGRFLQWSFNQPVISDGQAIFFSPWGTGRVAVYGAQGNPPWAADIQSKLAARMPNIPIDTYYVTSGNPVPTLDQLRNYKSVMVYSDAPFNDPVALGNVLADYVDIGGGVVMTEFAFYNSPGYGIAGRLVTDDYLPFTPGPVTSGSTLTLVPVQPTHLILNGVASFNGGTASYHSTGLTPTPGATLVAQWNDGTPLVGAKGVNRSRTVGLNFYPPSSDARSDLWVSTTDGGLLMANALKWAGSPAPANPATSVAVYGAPVTAAWNDDVRSKVSSHLPGNQVDTYLVNAGQHVPTLAELKSYKSVLVYSDAPYYDPVALGNVLADYVDSGGGVVLATFSYSSGSWGIAGRLVTGNYLPLTIAGDSSGTALTMVPVLPAHPILQGVASFGGGTATFHEASTTTAGATLIANWNNGQPLIAVKTTGPGHVVALNFYPPSSDARSDFWTATTDGGLIMANALNWAGEPTKVGPQVAIYGAPTTASWNDDVKRKVATSLPTTGVDAFLAGSGQPVPTLAQLLHYDSVLVYSDTPFNDPVAMGNVLADYVDAGGGVVVATFALNSTSLGIAGRLLTGNYLPVTQGAQSGGSGLTLTPVLAAHQILQGVNSFNGGSSSYLANVGLAPGAVLVANWSSGQPLIATRTVGSGRVVALNFYPPSSDARGDFWSASTDGGTIMGNALRWAGASRQLIVNASYTGWWDSTGFHSSGNLNYLCGEDNFSTVLYRDFFVFDVPRLTRRVVQADLILNSYNINSPLGSEILELHSVTTPIATLEATGSGQTAIYTDLGDGTLYGGGEFYTGQSNHRITVPLNTAFLTDLPTAAGTIALGGQLNPIVASGHNDWMFAFSSGNPGDAQLVLTFEFAPVLEIALVGNQVQLSWALTPDNWQLQSCPDLGNPVWTAVPDRPQIINGFKVVTIPRDSSQLFFRLWQTPWL